MPLSVEVPHLAILADPAEGEEYRAAPTEVRAHLVLEAARSEPEVAAEVESEAVPRAVPSAPTSSACRF